MVNKPNFTEDDKEKVVKFLNTIAAKAKFEMNTSELIDYFRLLQFMQQVLLPKIDSHILEIKRVIQPKAEVKE